MPCHWNCCGRCWFSIFAQLASNQFSIYFRKTKAKVIQRQNRTKVYIIISQWEFKVKIIKLLEGSSCICDSVTFWINYRAKLSKTKAILDYFRNSIENCSIDHGSSGTEFWRATTGQYLSWGWGEGGVRRFGFVTIKFTNHPPAGGWSLLTVLRVSLQTLHWLVTTTSNDAMYLTSYSITESQEALRSTPPEMS